MPKLKIVEVIWNDTFSDAGWKDVDKIMFVPLPVCTTVGYLLHKDEHVVRLAHSLNEGQADFTLIPTGCVLKIRMVGGHVDI